MAKLFTENLVKILQSEALPKLLNSRFSQQWGPSLVKHIVIECQVVGGWKGWKKITIYWKIWEKWLENHIQIAQFWLEFF